LWIESAWLRLVEAPSTSFEACDPELTKRRVHLHYLNETLQMDKSFAEHFAADWIEAWNAHDLGRILAHYAEDFEMSSPAIIQIAGEPTGTLRGRAAVGAYWKKALDLMPDLEFELLSALAGISSITLCYKGGWGRLAAEVFHFGPDKKVAKAFAHYAVNVRPNLSVHRN
jgi:hypothetical protein